MAGVDSYLKGIIIKTNLGEADLEFGTCIGSRSKLPPNVSTVRTTPNRAGLTIRSVGKH